MRTEHVNGLQKGYGFCMKKVEKSLKGKRVKMVSIASMFLLFPIYIISLVLFRTAISRDNRIPMLESKRFGKLLRWIQSYMNGMTEEENVESGKGMADFYEQLEEGKQWFLAQNKERITITSYDELRLVAYFLPAEKESKKVMILMHGYRSDGYCDFSGIKRFCHENGYHILVPHQRSHGDSEGKYICYGVKERYDVLQWSQYIADRFGADCSIYLYGISMGAASVMMASNLSLPGQVKGIIADCGFTSPWDIFTHVLRTQYHLPRFPFLYAADFICWSRAGFRMKDCSTVQCLEETEVPVLFIHGSCDHFVPVRMTYANYEACSSKKEILIVDGAAHASGNLVDPEAYRKKLIGFMERYENKG